MKKEMLYVLQLLNQAKISMFCENTSETVPALNKLFLYNYVHMGAWCINQDDLGSNSSQLMHQNIQFFAGYEKTHSAIFTDLACCLTFLYSWSQLQKPSSKMAKSVRTRETLLRCLLLRAWMSFPVISRNHPLCWPEGDHYLLLNNALMRHIWAFFGFNLTRFTTKPHGKAKSDH